ncbi:hypothetical protein IFM89_025141 [Coptis chinensis]|uniref:Protein kinase domain-containing protein n=1 Tax=Coptis chinensis TaxID=261450 RepID=A0A835IY89_9MAGN|nr:hypothetical protein IFM89_025141 [Coptis chinensis]
MEHQKKNKMLGQSTTCTRCLMYKWFPNSNQIHLCHTFFIPYKVSAGKPLKVHLKGEVKQPNKTEKKMTIVFEEHEYWKRGEMLGQGSFGTVHLAFTDPTKTSSFPPVMAVKSTAYSEASSLMKENDKLIELQGCPYIIGHYGDDDNVEDERAYYNMFLEYASLGSLGDRIK